MSLNKTTMKLHKPTTRLLIKQPKSSVMMMLKYNSKKKKPIQPFFKKKTKLEIIMKKLMKGKTIVKMKPTTKLKLNKKKIKIPGLIKTSHLKDNQRFKKGQQ